MHTVLESEFQNQTCKSICPFLNIQLNDSSNRKLKWSSSFTVPNSSCLKWRESMCAIKYPNFVYSTGKFVSYFTISKHCCELIWFIVAWLEWISTVYNAKTPHQRGFECSTLHKHMQDCRLLLFWCRLWLFNNV